MVKIDLVTGFLGSGKTTFIKLYADYLIRQGNRIAIIENDYGAVNVDMMLLGELQSDSCELEMISGGCDKDCHIRRFRTKLISMAMLGFDRVIVEPSGIFDVDEFFDILREDPLERWYEIGSVICVMDSGLPEGLSDAAEYMLASEAANSGIVLLSKTDGKSPEQLDTVIKRLNSALLSCGCSRDIRDAIFSKNWAKLKDDDFKMISDSGYHFSSFVKKYDADSAGFESVYVFEFSEKVLKEVSEKLFTDSSYGRIFRIKGFFEEEGKWYEFNMTSRETTVNPIFSGQKIIIVIGEKLSPGKIKEAFI